MRKLEKKSKIFNLKNPPIVFTQNDLTTNKKENIELILNKLFDQEIQSVLVEGGGSTITAFLNSGMFDEIHVYLAPKFFGKGIPIYQREGINDNAFKLKLIAWRLFQMILKSYIKEFINVYWNC